METVFHALDDDASGELDYVEFCHQLGSCKRRDPLMLTALTRYNVTWRSSEGRRSDRIVALMSCFGDFLTNDGFSLVNSAQMTFVFWENVLFLGPSKAIPR